MGKRTDKTALKLVDPKAETARLKARFDELLKKTNKTEPKEADVEAFREFLCGNREHKLFDRISGVMGLAENYLLQAGSPVSPGLNEILREKQRVIREEMGHAEASRLEQLLISHAALCWLRLVLVEMNYTRVMSQSITLTLGAYWEKRLTAAQRRFERACETLERARLLARSKPGLHLAGTKAA